MRIMYDSVTPADIPLTGATMFGCYDDGTYENVIAMSKRFPRGQIIPVDVNGSDPKARVLDYEPGDVQNPGKAAQWCHDSIVRGNKWPTVYCDRSDMPVVIKAVSASGLVLGKDWWLWISTLDMTWKQFQGVTGVAAVQYQSAAGYDVSVVLDDNWIPAPDHVSIEGWELAKPSPSIVPVVVGWYGNEGATFRQANLPRALWGQIPWTPPGTAAFGS